MCFAKRKCCIRCKSYRKAKHSYTAVCSYFYYDTPPRPIVSYNVNNETATKYVSKASPQPAKEMAAGKPVKNLGSPALP